jgi:hypothetical protein
MAARTKNKPQKVPGYKPGESYGEKVTRETYEKQGLNQDKKFYAGGKEVSKEDFEKEKTRTQYAISKGTDKTPLETAAENQKRVDLYNQLAQDGTPAPTEQEIAAQQVQPQEGQVAQPGEVPPETEGPQSVLGAAGQALVGMGQKTSFGPLGSVDIPITAKLAAGAAGLGIAGMIGGGAAGVGGTGASIFSKILTTTRGVRRLLSLAGLSSLSSIGLYKRQEVSIARTSYSESKSSMGDAVNYINQGGDPVKGWQMYQQAYQNILDSETALKGLTDNFLEKFISGGADELIKIEMFKNNKWLMDEKLAAAIKQPDSTKLLDTSTDSEE